MPPRAFTILWYSPLKIASASFSLATFWRKSNSILARVPSFQMGGSTAPSSRPLMSLYFWITWWIMYMIQVPIGSTSTCAPSLCRKLNMLKLPSPSVVCAQNSPVILTIGFTRRRSISTLVEGIAAVLERRKVLVALELLDELADVLGGIAEPAQVLGHARFELPRLLLAEDFVQVVHAVVERLIGGAGFDFVRTERVGHLVHHVAAVQRVQDAEEEVEVHLQAGFGVGLREAARLLEQQHAEAVEPGVAQRQAVFRLVHAEAAGTAGAGGEEDVPVDDLLLA